MYNISFGGLAGIVTVGMLVVSGIWAGALKVKSIIAAKLVAPHYAEAAATMGGLAMIKTLPKRRGWWKHYPLEAWEYIKTKISR